MQQITLSPTILLSRDNNLPGWNALFPIVLPMHTFIFVCLFQELNTPFKKKLFQ